MDREELDTSDVQQVILTMPFENFELRKSLEFDSRDLAFVRFALDLWKQIKPGDLAALRDSCEQSIAKYYDQLEKIHTCSLRLRIVRVVLLKLWSQAGSCGSFNCEKSKICIAAVTG